MTIMTQERVRAMLGQEPIRVGEVALIVRDLPRTEAFYRDVIGLEVTGRAADAVRLGAGGADLLELQHRPDALRDDQAAAGLFHTAFLLPTRTDLARWLAHAGRLRYRLDGASDHDVSEAVYLRDPDGNGVEVYADRPRALWRWTDGRIAMGTQRLDIPTLLLDAEGEPSWPGAPAGTRVGHVHLRVGDVAEAVRFYGGVVGLNVTATRPGAAFLSSGGYHHHVAANTWQSAGAGPRDPRMAGLAAATLEVASEPILQAIARRAETADLAGDGLRDPWGTALRFRLA